MTLSLAQHRAAVEAAANTMNTARKALLRPDGQPLYGQSEHTERERGIYEAFRRVLADATEAAHAAMAEAAAELERVHPDPLLGLSPSELETANARRAFVEQDYAALPLPELARRLEAALDGDRATRFLAWRAATAKASDAVALMRAGRSYSDPAASRAAVTIETLAGRLLGSLVDLEARERAGAAAKARQSEATALAGRVALVQHTQDSYGRRPAEPARGSR